VRHMRCTSQEEEQVALRPACRAERQDPPGVETQEPREGSRADARPRGESTEEVEGGEGGGWTACAEVGAATAAPFWELKSRQLGSENGPANQQPFPYNLGVIWRMGSGTGSWWRKCLSDQWLMKSPTVPMRLLVFDIQLRRSRL